MFDTMRMGASGVGEAYEIERSLRFDVHTGTTSGAHLQRTFGSAGNRKTWTFSFWAKKTGSGIEQVVFNGGGGGNPNTTIRWDNDESFHVFEYNSGFTYRLHTNRLFRDPASWYHIVVTLDTTQETADNRIKIYVNGVQETSFANRTNPAQDTDYTLNNNIEHTIGNNAVENHNANYFNGYLTEIHFVNGTALDASSFGKTNTATGQWIPKKYTGSHGTNGFYLNFSDNSGTTSSTLGDDDSANSNDWTPNNFSVTADTAGNDSVLDTPTNNYATWNSQHWCVLYGAGGTALGPDYTQGNLRFVGISSGTPPYQRATGATIVVNSGAWYFEVTIEDFNNGNYIGVADANNLDSNGDFVSAGMWTWNCWDSRRNIAGTITTSWGSRPSDGDVVGCAVDIDNNTIEWFVNNTSQGETTNIGISGKQIIIGAIQASFADERYTANFGQQGFKYTPPTGFNALCTKNLPEPTILKGTDYFNTVLYTGSASSNNITGVGFQPDLVWCKNRSNDDSHALFDSVRGVTKRLRSDEDDAEVTDADTLTSFDSDGFSLGADAAEQGVGGNTDSYAAWNWKGGSSTVSNSDGSITTQVRALPSAGFSIATYTGDNASATIGHGLGVAPEFVIIKRRDAAGDWIIGHKDLAASAFANNKFLKLNTNDDTFDNSLVWGSQPTSSVAQIVTGSSADNLNGSSMTYVAYFFTGVEGYSKFGSYIGNGVTNGPFVYTGFRPAVVIAKATNHDDSWNIWDSTRDPYNLMVHRFGALNANHGETTTTNSASSQNDFYANGFKWRGQSNDTNGDDDTYIYAAFAETPFKYANAR